MSVLLQAHVLDSNCPDAGKRSICENFLSLIAGLTCLDACLATSAVLTAALLTAQQVSLKLMKHQHSARHVWLPSGLI